VRFAELLVLAVGLAMDATAVSATKGLAVPRVRLRHALLVAGFFGGFQAGMPVLGWLLGASIGGFVHLWSHWLAFIIFAAIGGKMLWEARKHSSSDPDQAPTNDDPSSRELFGLRVMFVLAVATSIDAFAAGISLSLVGAKLLVSIATIGLVTAAFSIAGLYAGRRFGAVLGRRLDVVGGLVLIGLGVKVLVEHYLG
jgi:putative Mn2+ efflux pump MntP